MTASLKLLYDVFKLRIGLSIMLCALAGAAMAPGGGPGGATMALLATAVLLSSASAGAFNQFVERDLDRQMARTRGRPFVTGRLEANGTWLALIVLLTLVPVALVAWRINATAAAFVFLGAFFYGVVYTVWLKRRTWLNIVLGGLAGSFAVLAGAAAVDPSLAPAPLILATVLFLWTPPHFWSLAIACRDDYERARIPMLPVVAGDARAAQAILAHTIALCVLSLAPLWYGMGWIYLLGAATGGAWFLRTSLALYHRPDRPAAVANFRASLAQLTLLLTTAIADATLLG